MASSVKPLFLAAMVISSLLYRGIPSSSATRRAISLPPEAYSRAIVMTMGFIGFTSQSNLTAGCCGQEKA